MKIYTVRITRQAQEHLQNIKNYILNVLQAPEAAFNTISILRKVIESLDVMPSRIKLTDEEPWRSKQIHRMPVKNFYTYFWIDEEESLVQVIAVIYAARDQNAQLELQKI